MIARVKWIAAGLAVGFVGLGIGVGPGAPADGGDGAAGTRAWIGLGVQEAVAQPARRVARRTARRTTRRTSARYNYINTLPAGCALRGVYHYCGGVYYQPVVQGGATVYVVVTP